MRKNQEKLFSFLCYKIICYPVKIYMCLNLLAVVQFVVCVCEKPEHTIKKSSRRINTIFYAHTYDQTNLYFYIHSHTPLYYFCSPTPQIDLLWQSQFKLVSRKLNLNTMHPLSGRFISFNKHTHINLHIYAKQAAQNFIGFFFIQVYYMAHKYFDKKVEVNIILLFS